MTSGSTLPTFGAAPPDIRRAPIPRDLQPSRVRASQLTPQQPAAPTPEAIVRRGYLDQSLTTQTDARGLSDTAAERPSQSGRPVSVASQALISAQEQEGNGVSAAAQSVSQNLAANNDQIADGGGANAVGLSDDEQAHVRELKAIDREVRAHEAAHATAGGGLAGRPVYEFVTGPDGIRYAVSGRVEIDTGVVGGDPSATIRKLETVRRAALAPAKPSAQDRSVAAQAEAGIRAAQAELNSEKAVGQTAETSDADEDLGTILAANNQLDQSVSLNANQGLGDAGSGNLRSGDLIVPASLNLLA